MEVNRQLHALAMLLRERQSRFEHGGEEKNLTAAGNRTWPSSLKKIIECTNVIPVETRGVLIFRDNWGRKYGP